MPELLDEELELEEELELDEELELELDEEPVFEPELELDEELDEELELELDEDPVPGSSALPPQADNVATELASNVVATRRQLIPRMFFRIIILLHYG